MHGMTNKIYILILIGTSMFLGGCSLFHTTPEDQASYYINNAFNLYDENKDLSVACNQINMTFNLPTGDRKLAKAFSENPNYKDKYYSCISTRIDGLTSASSAIENRKILTRIGQLNIFDINTYNSLIRKIENNVYDGNINGVIPFTLNDSTHDFPKLLEPEQQKSIFNNSVKRLEIKEQARKKLLEVIISFVNKSGVNSEYYNYLKSYLPTINFTKDEVKQLQNLYPDYSKTRMEELTVLVNFKLINGDRILYEDIFQAIKNKINGIEWVNETKDNVLEVIVEKIRNDEHVLPEHTQSITYSYWDVDPLNRIFNMPRDASFIYDVTSGGSEVEYGYAITANFNNKKIHDELVRGKITKEFGTCKNARVQNVFGGTTSANFIANSDMKNRCNLSSSVSIESLRSAVYNKISIAVLNIPKINDVQQ